LLPQEAAWAERVQRMGRAAGERRWPGATALVLLLSGGRLYAANAGDCRAVLCSQVRLRPALHAHTPLSRPRVKPERAMPA
jgi:serine/threonine protein phosphatase PrpC